jgi:hypothetical protein
MLVSGRGADFALVSRSPAGLEARASIDASTPSVFTQTPRAPSTEPATIVSTSFRKAAEQKRVLELTIEMRCWMRRTTASRFTARRTLQMHTSCAIDTRYQPLEEKAQLRTPSRPLPSSKTL